MSLKAKTSRCTPGSTDTKGLLGSYTTRQRSDPVIQLCQRDQQMIAKQAQKINLARRTNSIGRQGQHTCCCRDSMNGQSCLSWSVAVLSGPSTPRPRFPSISTSGTIRGTHHNCMLKSPGTTRAAHSRILGKDISRLRHHSKLTRNVDPETLRLGPSLATDKE